MSNLNLNKVILAGRLCADPELKQTTSGIPVITYMVGQTPETGADDDLPF